MTHTDEPESGTEPGERRERRESPAPEQQAPERPEPERSDRPERPLLSAVLKPFAAPRLNMREDYEKVRRFQRRLASRPGAKYQALDRELVSAGGSHEIPLRIFVPKELTRDEVLLFFHGGGWVTGDIESYSPSCATMAELTGCIVASVDYRLAPEHPFPAGLEDCLRITRLVLADPELVGAETPEQIVLVGDSAGANLAAVVSQQLRDSGEPGAARQILLYPVTHWDHDPHTSPFASVRNLGDDYRLTNTEVQDYLDLYAPIEADQRSARVAPLLATDFSSQPKTLLLSAGLDLLRDEGEAYAEALAVAGNDVRVHRVEGALHGFITLPRFSRSLREGYEVITEFLDGGPAEPGGEAGGA